MTSDTYRLLTVPITCVHCGLQKRIAMTDGCEPPEYGYDRAIFIQFVDKTSKCCTKPTYYMDPAGVGIFAEERKARIMHVFRCPVCGYEGRLNDKDMKNLKRIFCGNLNCSNIYCDEVRVEIVDNDGNVGSVIV